MLTKFVRFIATLAIVAGIIGNTGIAYAADGSLPRSSGYQPSNIPALSIPPASSLGVQFVQVATAANISGDGTIIDHPLTNGNPNANIIVTPNWNPGNMGGTYDNHPIGVYYNGSNWVVFNQDTVAMPVGAAFNVIIPTAGAGVFVQTATTLNIIVAGSTTIDNPLTNGHPNAMILVTQNWNPGGGGGTYNNHPVGVWYSAGKWTIFNEDGAPMPVGAAFTVFVLTAGAGVFVQTSSAGNILGDHTRINNVLTNGHPNAIVFVTPNRNPGNVGGIGYDHNLGVYYDGSQWAIFNQNTAAMPANASFNVLVLVPSSDIYVHRSTAGNSIGNHTLTDNALTNGHPNAIVFATPNLNPGGVVTYANFPIGMFYQGAANQWSIFNQNGVSSSMPVNAAFNVLIPNPDTSVFVHKATAVNIAAHITTIDYPLTNGNPNAIILVTPNWNPGNVGGTYNNHPIGVYYVSGKWRIFNEDTAAMPVNASFNVYLPTAGPGVGVFVHTATSLNTGGNVTGINNALTNHNPNAIILVTQNWDPGGVGGIYNSHSIGVYYNGSEWEIFNQDLAAIPIGASFNVYVFANFKIYLPLVRR